MLNLYLIRHAQSDLNKLGVTQGSGIDSDLSETGKIQAKKLVNRFKNMKISKIFCSDLKRSFGTAKTLSNAFGVEITSDLRLRELNVGEWADGKSNALKKWIEFYESEKAKGIPRENIRPPGGENSWDHIKRAENFLESINDMEGNILVVGHSGTNKVIIGLIQRTDPDSFYTFKQENACVNELEFDGKTWKVLKINDTAHLNETV